MRKFKFYRLIVFVVAGLVANSAACAEPSGGEPLTEIRNMGARQHVTVGVKDLDVAVAQWVDLMGLEIRSRREGPDTGLASLWQIAPDDIERQAMIGTPGVETGLIHLVQFRDPDPPVREGAEVFDLLPKNLDFLACAPWDCSRTKISRHSQTQLQSTFGTGPKRHYSTRSSVNTGLSFKLSWLARTVIFQPTSPKNLKRI